jgi:hypothetical protein
MFYLNGTQIEEPAGFTGLYWTRVRHADYFGIWRHRTARVMGIGECGFDGEAGNLLRTLWEKDGPQASAFFEVAEGDQIIFKSEVDFGIKNDNGRYFNCGFRDDDAELDSLSDLKVSVPVKIQCEFPQQMISEGLVYSIGLGLAGPFHFSGTTHSVPFVTAKSGEGNGLSVTNPTELESIYRNGTNRKSVVKLEGKLTGSWSGYGAFSIIAQLLQGAEVKDSKTIAILNTSGSEQSTYISDSIEVPQGSYLRLAVVGSNNITATYNAESYLTIYENSESATQLIWGVTLKQAFESLVKALAGSTVTISSRYLSKGLGASRIITSERNLRGYKSNIQMSFKSLFDDMNAIDNLACWKRGNVLYIETKADMLGKVGRSLIEDYETLNYSANPFFASVVKSGYSQWKSDTAAGRDEFCTERTHYTRQDKIKNSRDLTVKSLSASGKVMEILRRNPNSDKADTSQDEMLFVIVASKSGSIFKAVTGGVENVISPSSVINAGISPRNNLAKWMNILGVNGDLVFSAGTGNIDAKTGKTSEQKTLPAKNYKQLFSKNYATIETGMTMREYSELGEVVDFYDHNGTQKSILVMEDSYRFASGKATLKGIELS